MAESGKGNLLYLFKFFGKRDGQTMQQFRQETLELSEKDTEQLVSGIKDGTFDY